MKAGVAQQRSLLELAKLDAELTRIAHRATHLPQRAAYQQVQAEHNAANDRMAALRIAAEDLDGQVSRFESEIDAVRKRGDRDRSLLTSGATDAKQLADLQHELDSLQRRQASLEDACWRCWNAARSCRLNRPPSRGRSKRCGPTWPPPSRLWTRHLPKSTKPGTNIHRNATC